MKSALNIILQIQDIRFIFFTSNQLSWRQMSRRMINCQHGVDDTRKDAAQFGPFIIWYRECILNSFNIVREIKYIELQVA